MKPENPEESRVDTFGMRKKLTIRRRPEFAIETPDYGAGSHRSSLKGSASFITINNPQSLFSVTISEQATDALGLNGGNAYGVAQNTCKL